MEIRVVALDLDGVVYEGNRACTGAPEAIAALIVAGFSVVFITNSSGALRTSLADKLTGMGVRASEADILTSSLMAGQLIAELSRDQSNPTIHVIGTNALWHEIRSSRPHVTLWSGHGRCDFLVVGFCPAISYDVIAGGLDAVNGGATMIACNRDASFPADMGRMVPGCGAILGAIEGACGRRADFEAGKPNTRLLEAVSRQFVCSPAEILVIGDSIESDIEMATRFGSPSVLVARHVQSDTAWKPTHQPNGVIHGLRQLPEWLARHASGLVPRIL